MKKKWQLVAFIALLALLLSPLLVVMSIVTPERTTWVEYTVKEEDTCNEIAFQYGVNVASLVKANNLNKDCTILINQKLRIPPPGVH